MYIADFRPAGTLPCCTNALTFPSQCAVTSSAMLFADEGGLS